MAQRKKLVGARIKQARKAKRPIMLQKELALAVHVEPQTISNWERGVSEPDLAKLERVAQVTGKPLGFFVSEDGETIVSADQTATLLTEIHVLRAQAETNEGLLRELLSRTPAASSQADTV